MEANLPDEVGRREFRLRVGAALREKRRSRGWSRAELARRSGLSSGQLSRVERGQATLSSQFLLALAGALEVPVADLTASSEPLAVRDVDLLLLLERLAIPRANWLEFLDLPAETRRALADALSGLMPRESERAQAAGRIEELLSANRIEAVAPEVVREIMAHGVGPTDFLRACVQFEELDGERRVLADRLPMVPVAFACDQMQLFRDTYGMEPPDPLLLKWWADARHSALAESMRHHVSRTIYPLERFQRYIRYGEHAPGVTVSYDTVRAHLSALIDLLRSQPRYLLGFTDETPALAFWVKGNHEVLISGSRYFVNTEAPRRGVGMRFARAETVAIFRAYFDDLWERIPKEQRDSAVLVEWLTTQLETVGQ